MLYKNIYVVSLPKNLSFVTNFYSFANFKYTNFQHLVTLYSTLSKKMKKRYSYMNIKKFSKKISKNSCKKLQKPLTFAIVPNNNGTDKNSYFEYVSLSRSFSFCYTTCETAHTQNELCSYRDPLCGYERGISGNEL